MNKKSLVLLLMFAMIATFLFACSGSQAKSYTVTFDTDGGSSVSAATVEEGKTAAKPTAPTKEHYTFAGWYLGDAEYNFTTPVTSDVTIKAKWTVNSYTVSFNPDNGGDVTTVTLDALTTLEAPEEPEKENEENTQPESEGENTQSEGENKNEKSSGGISLWLIGGILAAAAALGAVLLLLFKKKKTA